MHTPILKWIFGRALSGLRPYTPRCAPYLPYGRAVCLSMLCLALCGCAGSNARESAVQTLESYTKACAAGRTQNAQALLMPNANQDVPCPDETVAEKIQVSDRLIYTADIGHYRLTDSGNGWRIDMRQLMNENSPESILSQLCDALIAEDFQALTALILPSRMPQEDAQTFWAKHAASLNALYAAISATAVPWFQMEGQRAICDVSGILLTFEVHDGRWYWVPNLF